MSHSLHRCAALAAAIIALGLAGPSLAQDDAEEEDEGHRYRVGLGPQVYPSYPGSDDFDFGPLLDYGRARGDAPFAFEAPDESFDLTLLRAGGFRLGPAANFEGTRTAEDVGVAVPKVDFSVELGGFATLQVSDRLRLRGELRKGLSGHEGWIGVASADFVWRDGDKWLVSIGPRLTWSDEGYQDAWFGISPATASVAGLPAYDPGGGIHAVGATASFLTSLGGPWGLSTYAKYDRLVGDAADSPLVTGYGSRNQLSGGFALTYTFRRGGD